MTSIRTVLAATLVAVAALAAAAQEAVDLSSPRATFTTFLTAMNAVRAGDARTLRNAEACLDLSGYAPAIRDEAGERLARSLKTYLDKIERIDLESVPTEVDGDVWTWRSTPEGDVSVVRGDGGRWRFARWTLEALPALLSSVRDRGFVEGLTGGGRTRRHAVAQWLRDRSPEALRKNVFLLEGWQWAGLLLIAIVGVVADRVTRYTLGVWMRRLLRRAVRGLDRETADLNRPIGILVMAAIWSTLLRALDLPLDALNALVVATRFIMAAAGVWAAYRLVDLLAAYFGGLAARTDSTLDDLLVPLLRRALKLVVVAFGVLFVAQNLDINVSSLLAGLGIGGIAFALAAKDTVENLFGSVTVLTDRPFKIGDWIKIGDLEGTVEELGLRSTRIRTFYNSLITVPNSSLVRASVDNLGERRYRRIKSMIAIQYDTPPDRIEAFCEGIRELVRRHPYTRKDYYMVYLNEFADSSLNVLLYAFVETPDWATELRERHRLFVDIVRLAARLGVEFAFPTQTLHVASMPGAPATVPGRADDAEDAVVLGRREAAAVASEASDDDRQPPVSFGEPDGMATRGGAPR